MSGQKCVRQGLVVMLLLALVVGSVVAQAAPVPEPPFSGGPAGTVSQPESWAWHTEVVDGVGDVGQYTSLAFAADDTPHIAYYATGDLKHAYISATAWVSETVDITGDVGSFASIAVAGAGRVGIAYYDATGEDLKYWDSAGQWSGVVDSTGNVGQYAALAFDSQGLPHISYYDVSNGNLKHAYRNMISPSWQISVVDGATAGDVGRYTSLTLVGNDPNGVAISYYDVTNGNLKFAWWSGSAWSYTVVDSQGDVGQWTSLEVDSVGLAHIMYTAGGTTLKHAWRSGPTWQTEIVDESMQGYNSLALGQNYPQVSYQKGGQLRYAYKDSTGWHYETVDTTGEVGAYNSLALDRADYPHISYRDAANFDLKYAYACCDARFSATPQPQCVAQPVQFQNSSRGVGEPFTYLWAFGDGATSTEISPTHAYAGGGTYTTWLTATAACGIDTMTATVVISSTPEADFTWGPFPVCAEWKTTQFTNTTVGSPTLTYQWASDDGWTSTLEHPTHTFALPGVYDVVLIATNGCGLDTVTQPVQAHGAPQEVTPTWTPQPPEVGNVVTFTGQASSTLPVNFWLWEFGDGGMASGESVTYTYAATGTYTVLLTAANGCGINFGEAEITVVCYPVVSPDFFWAPDPPTVGFPTTFSATVGGGTTPVTYEWDFGDGQAGTGAVVEHTYVATGTYSVVLTATNYCGEAEVSQAVVVMALPQARFVSNAPVCYGQTVVFTNTSGGGEPLSFLWAFGDGQTSTLRNPTHAYNTGGLFTVTLTATNPYGQAHTSAPVLVVDGVSTADFTWEPAYPAPGEPVTLTATTNGTEPVTYEWNLGDGITATGQVVVHTYATTSTYTATLQAYNDCGGRIVEHPLNVSFCTAPAGLTAAFTPTVPAPGTVVAFTATLLAGTSPTIAWDFGDGTPWAYGSPVTHTYAATGIYTTSVAAWNSCGYAGPENLRVEVHFPARPGVVYLPLVYKGYCADAFEPDDTAGEAHSLVLGMPQTHNFSPEGDEDWTRLTLAAGTTYRFWTANLSGAADTRLYLYVQGQYGAPVAENDDWAAGNCGGTPPADPKQSCLLYTAPASGVYELKTDQYPGGAQWGCAVGYVLTAVQQ